MALIIRLAAGKKRMYRTSYSSRGENPDYHTKCGMFWIDRPLPEEECNHLDCAIKAAKHRNTERLMFLAFCLLIIAWGGSRILGAIFEGSLGIFMLAIGVLIFGLMIYVLYRSSLDKNELIEFKEKGTIRGTKAWMD